MYYLNICKWTTLTILGIIFTFFVLDYSIRYNKSTKTSVPNNYDYYYGIP